MPKRKLDPLPSAAFQILLSLAEGDRHGYGIMRQVEEQTGGGMRLGPGTLYSSIQAMLEEVDVSGDMEPGHERRRYYRLTAGGRKLARSEAEKLADFLRVARAKKILRGGICLSGYMPACFASTLRIFVRPMRLKPCNCLATGRAMKLSFRSTLKSLSSARRTLSPVSGVRTRCPRHQRASTVRSRLGRHHSESAEMILLRSGSRAQTRAPSL